MGDKTRKLRLKKLDALYITHNPLDCLIVYFCICFTFIRILYDIIGETAAERNAYVIALAFTVCMGFLMTFWGRRVFNKLELENLL
ncbi:MAG: hypothetical protein KAS66_11765 [Candidatus Omnitrophica bacterium]|nr:hypothetical protein [Candidatus Omnitrophota bacterium]